MPSKRAIYKKRTTGNFTQKEATKDIVDLEATKLDIESSGYSYSFLAKLHNASDLQKQAYNICIQEFSRYGLKVRNSWSKQTIYLGRKVYAKLVFKGKKLCICYALDPKELEGTKYKGIDISSKQAYAQTPFLFKITSDRKASYIKDLVDKECSGMPYNDSIKVTEYYEEMTLAELLDAKLVKKTNKTPFGPKEEVVEGIDPNSSLWSRLNVLEKKFIKYAAIFSAGLVILILLAVLITISTHKHVYSNDFTANEQNHYRTAICAHKGLKTQEEAHTFYHGTCTVCEYGVESATSDTVTVSNLSQSVKANAFTGCLTVKNVVIPESVKSIEAGSFDSTTNVYVLGDVREFDFKSDNLYYYSQTKPSDLTHSYWHYDENGKFALWHEHSYETKISYDINGHYYQANCGHDIKKYIEYHDLVNGVCQNENCNFDLSNETNIVVPDYCTTLSENAFAGNTKVESITLPATIKQIPDNAFKGCTSLTTVNMADTVTSIGISAFEGCTSLNTIVIPDSVKTIGAKAFASCTNLNNVTLSNNVEILSEQLFANCNKLTNVTLPSNLKEIDSHAFYWCNSLETITIPASCQTIKGAAFLNCHKLSNVVLSANLKTIEGGAFSECASLKSITLPEGLTTLGDGVFYNCHSLESLTTPSTLKTIGNSSFVGCNSLKTLTLNEGLESLGTGSFAFDDTKEFKSVLESVVIPSTLNSIPEYTFKDCTKLTKVVINEGVKSIDSHAFYNCSSLENITIPNSVNLIGWFAFEGCTKLTNVSLSSSLETLENGAFKNCSNLSDIELPQNLSRIGSESFTGNTSLKTVVIPEGVSVISTNSFDSTTRVYLENGNYSINYGITDNLVYYSKEEPTNINHDYWYYDSNNKATEWHLKHTFVNGVCSTCNLNITSNTNYQVIDGTTTISSNEYTNTNLSYIVLPESVTKVASDAFDANTKVYYLGSSNSFEKTTNVYNYSASKTANNDTTWAYTKDSNGTEIPYIIHTMHYYGYTPATCTEDGEEDAYVCSVCSANTGVDFKDEYGLTTINESDRVISKTRHSFEYHVDTQATCEHSGENANYYCTKCNEHFADYADYSTNKKTDWYIAKLDHTLVKHDAVQQCIYDGNIEYYECTTCNNYLLTNNVQSTDYVSHADIVLHADGIHKVNTSKVYAANVANGAYAHYYTYNCACGDTTTHVNETYCFETMKNSKCSVCQADYSSLTNITIPDGCMSINADAFKNNNTLTSITIPSSLVNIGSNAFYYCTALKAVNFSNINNSKLSSIPYMCFYNCLALTNITIPASVTSIGADAFDQCSTLTSVIFNDSANSKLRQINRQAFLYCRKLESLVIPASVEFIYEYAFGDCYALTSVKFEENSCLKYLLYGAFDGCDKLSSVELTSNSLETIDEDTFKNCYALNNLVLPEGVKTICENAFYCESLSDTQKGLVNITLPSTLENVEDGAFNNCKYLTNVYYLGSASDYTKIYFESDSSKPNLINTSLTTTLYVTPSKTTDLVFDNTITAIPSETFEYYAITSITLSDTIQSIGYKAFYYCTSLTSINSNQETSTLKSIGENAFNRNTSLTSLVVPNSVETIYDEAFEDCTALTTLTFDREKSKIKTIEDYAFDSCSNLSSFDIPNSLTSIGDSTFQYCGIKTITCDQANAKLNYIDDDAFYSCRKLESVYIPDSLEGKGYSSYSLGENIFAYCTSLTNVCFTANSKLKCIGDSMFYRCEALTSFDLPNSVVDIYTEAFGGCTNLSNITINKENSALTEIGYKAFSNTALTSFTAPNSLESISDYAFYSSDSNSKLISIELNEGLTYIGTDAFAEANITSLNIPSTVTNIYDFAFEDCSNLTTITIDKENSSLTAIGKSAFYNTGVTSFTAPNSLTTIGQYAFSASNNNGVVSKLTSVELNNGLTSIGSYAFAYSKITKITIPYTVSSIGNYAFANCSNLTTVTYANELGYSAINCIADHVYYEDTNLANLTLVDSIISIGESAFEQSALTNVSLSKYVVSIGKQAFAESKQLTSLTALGNVTINESAFSGCTNLTTIHIDNASEVSNDAFFNCINITDIYVGEYTWLYNYSFDLNGSRNKSIIIHCTNSWYNDYYSKRNYYTNAFSNNGTITFSYID